MIHSKLVIISTNSNIVAALRTQYPSVNHFESSQELHKHSFTVTVTFIDNSEQSRRFRLALYESRRQLPTRTYSSGNIRFFFAVVSIERLEFKVNNLNHNTDYFQTWQDRYSILTC